MKKSRKSRIFRRPLLRTCHKMATTRRMMETTARTPPKGNPMRKEVLMSMPQVSPGLATKNRLKS